MTIMGNLLSYLLTLSTIHSMKLSIYYIKGNPKGLQNDFELHSEIFYREREIFARLTITLIKKPDILPFTLFLIIML